MLPALPLSLHVPNNVKFIGSNVSPNTDEDSFINTQVCLCHNHGIMWLVWMIIYIIHNRNVVHAQTASCLGEIVQYRAHVQMETVAEATPLIATSVRVQWRCSRSARMLLPDY